MLKPALRERLLGALVFLCLGLILYPVIFDTRNDLVIDRESQIPLQTIRVAPLELQDPVAPENAQPAPQPNRIFVPDDTPTAPELPETAILDAEGLPQAWVLQIGSFGAASNASDVESRLLDAGYRAFQRQTRVEGETPLHRVMVGPYLDRRIAQDDLGAIQQLGLGSPMLLEFSP